MQKENKNEVFVISDKIKVNYYEKYLKSRRFTWKVQVGNKEKLIYYTK